MSPPLPRRDAKDAASDDPKKPTFEELARRLLTLSPTEIDEIRERERLRKAEIEARKAKKPG